MSHRCLWTWQPDSNSWFLITFVSMRGRPPPVSHQHSSKVNFQPSDIKMAESNRGSHPPSPPHLPLDTHQPSSPPSPPSPPFSPEWMLERWVKHTARLPYLLPALTNLDLRLLWYCSINLCLRFTHTGCPGCWSLSLSLSLSLILSRTISSWTPAAKWTAEQKSCACFIRAWTNTTTERVWSRQLRGLAVIQGMFEGLSLWWMLHHTQHDHTSAQLDI